MKYSNKFFRDGELNEPRIDDSKGGFFDLPKEKSCKHREHNPPTHICIPRGKGYRHVCPGCGNVTTIIPPQISL